MEKKATYINNKCIKTNNSENNMEGKNKNSDDSNEEDNKQILKRLPLKNKQTKQYNEGGIKGII